MASNIQKLYQYTTPDICDLLEDPRVMACEIKARTGATKTAGYAVTVELPAGVGRCAAIEAAFDQLKEDDVLVLAGGGDRKYALWGDKRSRRAMSKGANGVIVDGLIRDIEENIEVEFPIFARGIIPVASREKAEGRLNVPVSCGGVTVNPGDVIFADANGVVVLTKEELNTIPSEK